MDDSNLLERAAGLFNRKLYFECHDLLEEAWAEEKGEDRKFLQGLIHVSVGLYHLAAGNYTGATNLLRSGIEKLERFAPSRHGLDLTGLLERARTCLDKSERLGAGEHLAWGDDDVPEMRFEEGRAR
ncbi:MAG TPA: DUF309 domain-containing protein [Vicinamibacteria bacterium]|nr:DUF309 domain-containing protein [Vicinamibacteria bacterium]